MAHKTITWKENNRFPLYPRELRDLFVLFRGILGRTLLMLDVEGGVLADDISAYDIRQDRISCALSVTTRVAVVDIVSEGNSFNPVINQSISKKRKLNAICL